MVIYCNVVVVCSGDDEVVADSPYTITALPGPPVGNKCSVEGPGRRAAVAGAQADFTVYVRDAYGNACSSLGVDKLQQEVEVKVRADGRVRKWVC